MACPISFARRDRENHKESYVVIDVIYRKPDRHTYCVAALHTCSNAGLVVTHWWHFEQRR